MRLMTIPGVFRPISDSRMLGRVAVAEALPPAARVLDVCTGSGYLALTTALAGARDVTAIDVSRRAQLTVRINARLNGVGVRALRGDLLEPVAGERFDLIVSNPPYVPAETDELPARGRARAWDAGLDGRVFLDRLIDAAPAHLRPGGRLLVVHSSLIGAEATLERMRLNGLAADVAAEETSPLGPLMADRAAALEARGLLEPGSRVERVIVFRGRRAAATVIANGRRDGHPHPAHAQGLRT
jgi:release factor glutamine methyltransferase